MEGIANGIGSEMILEMGSEKRIRKKKKEIRKIMNKLFLLLFPLFQRTSPKNRRGIKIINLLHKKACGSEQGRGGGKNQQEERMIIKGPGELL